MSVESSWVGSVGSSWVGPFYRQPLNLGAELRLPVRRDRTERDREGGLEIDGDVENDLVENSRGRRTDLGTSRGNAGIVHDARGMRSKLPDVEHNISFDGKGMASSKRASSNSAILRLRHVRRA